MSKQTMILIAVILLLVFNLYYLFSNPGDVNPEDKEIAINELKANNEQLTKEKQELESKITGLQVKIDSLEKEEIVEEVVEEPKEEICTAKCGVDEICSLITKADGSGKWTCIRDPGKVLGV